MSNNIENEEAIISPNNKEKGLNNEIKDKPKIDEIDEGFVDEENIDEVDDDDISDEEYIDEGENVELDNEEKNLNPEVNDDDGFKGGDIKNNFELSNKNIQEEMLKNLPNENNDRINNESLSQESSQLTSAKENKINLQVEKIQIVESKIDELKEIKLLESLIEDFDEQIEESKKKDLLFIKEKLAKIREKKEKEILEDIKNIDLIEFNDFLNNLQEMSEDLKQTLEKYNISNAEQIDSVQESIEKERKELIEKIKEIESNSLYNQRNADDTVIDEEKTKVLERIRELEEDSKKINEIKKQYESLQDESLQDLKNIFNDITKDSTEEITNTVNETNEKNQDKSLGNNLETEKLNEFEKGQILKELDTEPLLRASNKYAEINSISEVSKDDKVEIKKMHEEVNKILEDVKNNQITENSQNTKKEPKNEKILETQRNTTEVATEKSWVNKTNTNNLNKDLENLKLPPEDKRTIKETSKNFEKLATMNQAGQDINTEQNRTQTQVIKDKLGANKANTGGYSI